jgi:superfamily II DNA or RNA helicase
LAESGVPFSDEVSARRMAAPACRTSIDIRPYQRAAITAWDLAGRRGVVALPTGSGKTRMAIAVIAETAVPTLCLVPTRVLLEQWIRVVRELTGYEPGVFGDGDTGRLVLVRMPRKTVVERPNTRASEEIASNTAC